MPFINMKTNISLNDEKKEAVKSAFGKAIEAIPGKTEDWLMVNIEDNCNLYYKGEKKPAAMLEVSVYGNENPGAFTILTRKICDILNEEISIEKSRIYVKYAATMHWGWNGGNF